MGNSQVQCFQKLAVGCGINLSILGEWILLLEDQQNCPNYGRLNRNGLKLCIITYYINILNFIAQYLTF